MNVYKLRPFKNRNAEDFELSQILDLFINPAAELQNPFDYENAIVKGRMGSGKTMYLRANLAYHLYSIIPCILNGLPITLPVLIRLSDFQHIPNPDQIYRAVILRIVEELSQIYVALQDCNRMALIHQGMQSLPEEYFAGSRLASVLRDLTRLSSEEYVQRITDKLGLSGTAKPKFLELSAKYEKETVTELKQKAQPGISDVKHAYDTLLGDRNGRILLLIDEAGSLARSFFISDGQSSLFETLMNQLRTAEFVRTKIAIYPHTYSDILVETRYGDLVDLAEDVIDKLGYARFRRKVVALIDRYLSTAMEKEMTPGEVFTTVGTGSSETDSVEQLINASGGNMRRLMSLLDLSMSAAYEEHQGQGKVQVNNVHDALRRHSASTEALYTDQEREFLRAIAQTCKSRRTFRFQFPNKAPVLYKYTSKSDEHNVVNVSEAGVGRRRTTYALDYSYCVYHDIPTHYVEGTERIDETRSRSSGEWIMRVAQISEELVQHATLFSKIEGRISYVNAESTIALVSGDDGKQYFLHKKSLIESDQEQLILSGRRIKFYPVQREKDLEATAGELL